MASVRRVDHLAIVVEDLDRALAFWRDALGLPLARTETLPEQQAEIAFLPLGGSQVELLRPTDTESGIARFLAKRGPGLHHVSFEVTDLPAMLRQLKARGVRLINEQPVPGAGGSQVAFVHPESTGGVLVELCQPAAKPRRVQHGA
ncbi:MAG: methylmalonyl-CoA epimerase [Chloroflexi bacterium]|nr:methylmalonyl-CoA epimerase [Chloroflexota bacterium]